MLFISLLTIGAIFVFGGAVWFGLIRGWPNLRGSARYSLIAMPWVALDVLLVAGPTLFQRVLGTELPAPVFTIQDVLSVAVTVIAMSVAWLQWPMWATPPWFRQMEKERHSAGEPQLSNTGNPVGEATEAFPQLSKWRRWRYVAVGASFLLLVAVIAVQSLNGPLDLFSIALSVFLAIFGGLGLLLDFKRNEARYRSHGWRW